VRHLILILGAVAVGCAGPHPPETEPPRVEKAPQSYTPPPKTEAELAQLEEDRRRCKAYLDRQEEERQVETRRKQAEEDARALHRALVDGWSARMTSSRPVPEGTFKELRDAYLRYIDMHAAGLQGKDEYKLLRATLTRTYSQIVTYDAERAVAAAVLAALLEVESSPPAIEDLNALVARAEAGAKAAAPKREEEVRKVRGAFERHLDDPDAPVSENLRRDIEAIKNGDPGGER
jgi:HrpA-like RNA helicase